MNSKHNWHFEILFSELANADINHAEYAPRMKRDAQDNYLGILPIKLQKLWIVKQEAQAELDETIQKISDVIECLKSDITDSNGELPEWKSSEYSLKLRDLVVPTKKLLKKWKALEDIFQALIKLFFVNTPEMPIFGVRKDYLVICRSNNSRNDIYNPLAPIVSAFGLGDFLKVHQDVIQVELPNGLDISKLSPKEILDEIMKRMK